MALTRAQAEQALAAVREQFKIYMGAGDPEPKLVEDWKPVVFQNGREVDTEPIPFAILWEEGPFEWADRARSGGIDEELTLEGRDFDPDYVARTPEAADWPKGVHGSPYFSWALGLYEE